MKILVCGDRHYIDDRSIDIALTHLSKFIKIDLIIEGEAKGADTLGRLWAEKHGIPVEKHPANWALYGRGAGPVRNAEMLNSNPDVIVAFHDNLQESKGTKNMVTQALKRGIRVLIVSNHQILENGVSTLRL
jgi:hypothetical protein